MFLSLLLGFALSGHPAHAESVAKYCQRYGQNEVSSKLMHDLAAKLMYSYEDFCASDRIMDVFQEDRLVYHREDDTYQKYKFITVHYDEYSCEYQYNLDYNYWGSQSCYNTW